MCPWRDRCILERNDTTFPGRGARRDFPTLDPFWRRACAARVCASAAAAKTHVRASTGTWAARTRMSARLASCRSPTTSRACLAYSVRVSGARSEQVGSRAMGRQRHWMVGWAMAGRQDAFLAGSSARRGRSAKMALKRKERNGDPPFDSVCASSPSAFLLTLPCLSRPQHFHTMPKIYKPGKVGVLLQGRQAGKKVCARGHGLRPPAHSLAFQVVVIQQYDDGNRERPFPHLLVTGLLRV